MTEAATDQRVAQVRQALAMTAGGFLRNLRREGTCARCFTPTSSLPICTRCSSLAARPGGIDALGMLTYAGHLVPISQSGHLMRGYKNPLLDSQAQRQTVALMAALALLGHGTCPGVLAGTWVSA
jgi:hypothetical protein